MEDLAPYISEIHGDVDPFKWLFTIEEKDAEAEANRIVKDINFLFRCVSLLCHANAEVNAILKNWDQTDKFVRSIATKQAVASYCIPFTSCVDEGGGTRVLPIKKFRHAEGFDRVAHVRLLDIRNKILAHHDSSVAKTERITKVLVLKPDDNDFKLVVPVSSDFYVAVLSGMSTKAQLESIISNVQACTKVIGPEIARLVSKLHVLPVRFPGLMGALKGNKKIPPERVFSSEEPQSAVFSMDPPNIESQLYHPTFEVAGDQLAYASYRILCRINPNLKIKIDSPHYKGELSLSAEPNNELQAGSEKNE